jgi:hypothetical protein
MKNKSSVHLVRVLGNLLIIALVAIIGFSMAACAPEEPEPRETITISEILGVTAPVAGERPVHDITSNEQFSGYVSWAPSSSPFEPLTDYTATIRLTGNEGWTTDGVPANFFTVAGATSVTHDANSSVITAVFPKTGLLTFTSITEFGTWLKNKMPNTAATPYTVKLNLDSLGGSAGTDESVGDVLNKYKTWIDYRFVILDLSDSTMTSIEDSAFNGCSGLIGVTIGDSVTEIGSSAFYYCSGLTSVNIPAAVTKIGSNAFYGCSGLTSVNIPAGVTEIGNSAFLNCYALTAIDVEAANAKYTSDGGVLYNKEKTTLIVYPDKKAGDSFTIPNSVTNISNAFTRNSNLTSITIPTGVTTTLTGEYFYSFAKLAAINVATEDTKYTSEDGVLYNKTKSTIIRYPASKTSNSGTFTIPSGVTEIGIYAFYNCDFTSMIIPATVTTIRNYAFAGCTNLTSVEFKGTIAANSFGDYTPFLGGLRAKYLATTGGGTGTYTRTGAGTSASPYVWTKEEDDS